MKRSDFVNTLSGDVDGVNYPKHGEIITMTMDKIDDDDDIKTIHDFVATKVENLKSSQSVEQQDAMDEKEKKFLSEKEISLVYISDEEIGEHSVLSSLFPISGVKRDKPLDMFFVVEMY